MKKFNIQYELPKFELEQIRGVNKACNLCQMEYGIFNKEHICKRCLRSICEQCGLSKALIYKVNITENKVHKICKKCKLEKQFLQQYVNRYKLELFKDSQLCIEWMKMIPANQQQLKNKNEYARILDQKSIVNKLWDSYNFSFKQFMGMILRKYKQQDMEQLNNKMIRFFEKLNKAEIKIQGNIYVIILIIIHCNEQNAFKMLRFLNKKFLHTQLNIQNIINYIKNQIKSDIQITKIQQYLDYKIKKYTQSWGFNHFPVQFNLLLLNNLLTTYNFNQIEKGIAALILDRKYFIYNNLYKSDLIDIQILRNYDIVAIEKYLNKFEKVNENNSQVITKLKQFIIHAQQQKQSQQQKTPKKLGLQKSQRQVIGEQYKKIVDNQKELVNNQKMVKKEFNQQYDVSLFHEIIRQKNKKIDDLKKQNQLLKLQCTTNKQLHLQEQKNLKNKIQKMQINENKNQQNIEQLKNQLQSLQKQKQSVKNMNELLIKKLNQLTIQIMNKQQKAIQELNMQVEQNIKNNDVQALEQVLKKDKCQIF